jgi:hypothetical protein
MKLQQWLEKEGVSVAALAKKIGVAKWTLNRYVITNRVPAPRVVVALYKATRGAVQPNDFYQLPRVVQ